MKIERRKSMIKLSNHFTYSKLFKFTLPSIGMMMFISIYTIVDGIFVSNFAGDIPFKALNLIFPFLMILGTVGFMFGTGGTALVAKTMGEGDIKKSNEYFSLFVYLTFVLGIIFEILGIIFMRPIATLLGATGELQDNCVLYGTIILLALPFLVLQYLFQSFIVAAEKPRLGLIITLISGITNIILDAILVLLLPKELKLAGAASATAFSQFIGGLLPLIYFSRKNNSILRLGKTKLYVRAIFKACINGSSEFMSTIAMNIVAMLYNIQLIKYAGTDGIAAYGVMQYIGMIFSGAFIGYTIGSAPIISYHYGAKNYDELRNVRKKGMVIICVSGLIMLLLAQIFAQPLTNIFVRSNKSLVEMTVNGFRIYSFVFPFMGFAIMGSGFFTALNDGVTSATISFLRTLVFQVGAVLLLPIMFKVNGIFASVVVAEFVAVMFTIMFLIIKRKKYNY